MKGFDVYKQIIMQMQIVSNRFNSKYGRCWNVKMC